MHMPDMVAVFSDPYKGTFGGYPGKEGHSVGSRLLPSENAGRFSERRPTGVSN